MAANEAGEKAWWEITGLVDPLLNRPVWLLTALQTQQWGLVGASMLEPEQQRPCAWVQNHWSLRGIRGEGRGGQGDVYHSPPVAKQQMCPWAKHLTSNSSCLSGAIQQPNCIYNSSSTPKHLKHLHVTFSYCPVWSLFLLFASRRDLTHTTL